MDMDLFGKFSDSARKVLTTAQKIAENSAVSMGTQHLLLAIASLPGTLAHEILREHNVSVDPIRLILSLHTGENSTGLISASAKKVIELATQSAARFNHLTVDAEHLLLAIVSLSDCTGYQILARIGIDPNQIRDQLVRLFEELVGLDQMIHQIDPRLAGVISHQLTAKEQEDIRFRASNQRPRANKEKSKTPALDYFSIDLTEQAKQGKLDPVIGRTQEIGRLMQILIRKTKNNPLLVGEPGVGKTAIVDSLAQLIAKNNVPEKLQGKRVVSLDLTLVVAGTSFRGQFEERLKKILEEIKSDPTIILFIDELHTIVGAGSAEGSLDAANIIKPALSKGQIRLIGAATTNEYRKHIERDTALGRRFQAIKVEEPTTEETLTILRGIKQSFEIHHAIVIADEALEAAVNLAKRYSTERFLPDSAIDLVDEAAASISLVTPNRRGGERNRLEQELDQIIAQKEVALRQHLFQQAAKLRQDEHALMRQLTVLKKQTPIRTPRLEPVHIATIVSLATGVPVGEMIVSERKRLKKLAGLLAERVVGQEEATMAIADAIKRSKTGISNRERPLGSFLFLGPTGVGKTLLAKTLAEQVFGSPKALVKIDMSEFREHHSVSGLIGAPPGYVGYEDASRLTEAVKRQPYSVVLLDEIEKAHPEIYNILLQILEDGYVTDSKGSRINFRNTIVILTSNLGTEQLNTQAIGFTGAGRKLTQAKIDYQELKEKLTEQLKEFFRPELLNRLDRIIIFSPLTKMAIRKITEIELQNLRLRLQEIGIDLSWTGQAVAWLAQAGFDPFNGARPLRRAITSQIETPLSDLIVQSGQDLGKIRISCEDNRLKLKPLGMSKIKLAHSRIR